MTLGCLFFCFTAIGQVWTRQHLQQDLPVGSRTAMKCNEFSGAQKLDEIGILDDRQRLAKVLQMKWHHNEGLFINIYYTFWLPDWVILSWSFFLAGSESQTKEPCKPTQQAGARGQAESLENWSLSQTIRNQFSLKLRELQTFRIIERVSTELQEGFAGSA